MNLLKRGAALGLCAAVTLSLAGCGSNTAWAAKAGDSTMSAGSYILSQIDAYYDASELYEKNKPDASSDASSAAATEPKDVLKADLEGKKGDAYIAEKTLEYVRRYFAADKLFAERGLSLTEADEAALNSNNSMIWQYSSEFYTKNGVSQDSVATMSRNYLMQDKLLLHLYGEDGEKALSDADYEEAYKQTRARVRFVPITLLDETGMPLSEEKAKEVEAKAQGYFDRAKAGETLDALIQEYETETGVAEHEHTVGSHDMVIREDSTSPSAEFTSQMFTAVQDELMMFKDAQYWYVAMRVDPLQDREAFEQEKVSLLKEMKQEEYYAWLMEQAAGIEIQYNDAALKRYSPSKLDFS